MKNKKRQRRHFSATFKARAVRLAKSSSSSVAQVARELQISEKTLYNWLRAKNEPQPERSDADHREQSVADKRIAELESELARLHRRCRELRLAAVYLADGER